ncbi:MAG: transporter, partial [Massilia sp.]
MAAGTVLAGVGNVSAESLTGALARAYRNNQDLNVARAQLRATDENVPQAKGGLRPRVTASGTGQLSRSRTTYGDNITTQRNRADQIGFGVTVSQTLFDGFQTPNNVRSAEATVKASQQNLANTEQNTLYDAATVYMNVLRDRQIAALRRQNLAFLNEQVRAASAEFSSAVASACSASACATSVRVPSPTSKRALAARTCSFRKARFCRRSA